MQVVEIGRLAVPSGRLAVGDPLTIDFSEPQAPLQRRTPTGVFPVELAIARFSDPADARVACARVRFMPPDHPVHRWQPAGFDGDDGDNIEACYGVNAGMGSFFDATVCGSVDEATSDAWLAAAHGVDTWTWLVAELGPANVVMFSSGWGDGFYRSYWGLDADDRIVELVTDFDVLLETTYERVELPLPLPRGRVAHPTLVAHGVSLTTPLLLSRTAVTIDGRPDVTLVLSDGSPVAAERRGPACRHTWKKPAPGVALIVEVPTGQRPLALA